MRFDVIHDGIEHRNVSLTESGLWLLFRAMVCDAIETAGIVERLDCHVWEFASSLDMSFEEVRDHDISLWSSIIERDLLEFMSEKQH